MGFGGLCCPFVGFWCPLVGFGNAGVFFVGVWCFFDGVWCFLGVPRCFKPLCSVERIFRSTTKMLNYFKDLDKSGVNRHRWSHG